MEEHVARKREYTRHRAQQTVVLVPEVTGMFFNTLLHLHNDAVVTFHHEQLGLGGELIHGNKSLNGYPPSSAPCSGR
jgi:hypothetical protein